MEAVQISGVVGSPRLMEDTQESDAPIVQQITLGLSRALDGIEARSLVAEWERAGHAGTVRVPPPEAGGAVVTLAGVPLDALLEHVADLRSIVNALPRSTRDLHKRAQEHNDALKAMVEHINADPE